MTIPPINSAPEPEKKTAKKLWHEWTIGELAQQASKVGQALYAGFKTAKEMIADKDDKK